MKVSGVFIAAVSLFSYSVIAGFDPGINVMQDYSGSADIELSGTVGGDSYAITGTIDYVVYDGDDYFGIGEAEEKLYVYAYQIFNDSGNVPVGYLSVGISLGASVEDVFIGPSFSESGSDVDPAFYDQVAQDVLYLFSGDSIVSGGHSSLLIFTSSNAPVVGLGTVSLGSLGGQVVNIPVPIPEPLTLVLLATGLIHLRNAEKRRRLAA